MRLDDWISWRSHITHNFSRRVFEAEYKVVLRMYLRLVQLMK